MIIATRKSPLALIQAEIVKQLLVKHHAGQAYILNPLSSLGDEVQDRPLHAIGGKAVFVSRLEQALVAGQADIAVHSLKDVPSPLCEGFQLACFLKRGAPSDVLISRHDLDLDHLPKGSIIGTSSPRRQAQLLRYRGDFKIVPLRGNLNTRLQRLSEGQIDAMVLAQAGVERLGWHKHITQIIPHDIMLPAVGQGTLVIECLAGQKPPELVALNDVSSELVSWAERLVCAQLGADCHTAMAVYGQCLDQGEFALQVEVYSPSGQKVCRAHGQCVSDRMAVAQLVEQLCQQLYDQGARALLKGPADE